MKKITILLFSKLLFHSRNIIFCHKAFIIEIIIPGTIIFQCFLHNLCTVVFRTPVRVENTLYILEHLQKIILESGMFVWSIFRKGVICYFFKNYRILSAFLRLWKGHIHIYFVRIIKYLSREVDRSCYCEI